MRGAPTRVLQENINLPTVKQKKGKILAFASIGNGLELYDFTLYGIMIPSIAAKFFPAENQLISLLIGYLSFAISFLIAPIGSIFWGWYGDKFGRIAMLRTSMIIMAIPSLGIALLPTYETIGLMAPILLITLRLMQGVSASGEIIGSKIFAMEQLGKQHFGLCSGVISAAGAMGVLLGLFMNYLTSLMADYPDFWRVPFLVGSALFLIARYIRKSMTILIKPEVYNNNKITKIFSILLQNKARSAVVIALGAFTGIISYSLFTFLSPFLISQGLDKGLVYKSSILGMVSTTIFCVVAGSLLDRYKRYLKSAKLVFIFTTLVYFPVFYLLLQGGIQTMLSYIILGGILGAYSCISTIIMYRSFPPEIRCRGVMFGYSLGCSIFGGLTPLMMQSLSGVHALAPSIVPVLGGLAGLTILKLGLKNADMF